MRLFRLVPLLAAVTCVVAVGCQDNVASPPPLAASISWDPNAQLTLAGQTFGPNFEFYSEGSHDCLSELDHWLDISGPNPTTTRYCEDGSVLQGGSGHYYVGGEVLAWLIGPDSTALVRAKADISQLPQSEDIPGSVSVMFKADTTRYDACHFRGWVLDDNNMLSDYESTSITWTPPLSTVSQHRVTGVFRCQGSGGVGF